MKQIYRKILAAGLSLSLLWGQAAFASDALGHDLHTVTTPVSEGVTVTRGYFWSDTYNDLRTERYVTYTPNEDVSPAVAFGDHILSRATLSAMAKTLEESGKRVVGGVNGDFYVLTTGQPLGLVVTDGVLRSSSSYHYAIGFRPDGAAFIGRPNLTVYANMLGERVTVFGGVNKIRQVRTDNGGGLTLLTDDFGANTQNTAPGVDVILKPVEGEKDAEPEVISKETTGLPMDLIPSDTLKIGGRVNCVVDYVTEAEEANPIPEGCFVLTMNGQDDEGTLNMLRSLQPGDPVSIDVVSQDQRWCECTEALGAMYRLLENGEIGTNLSTERTARTAIGVKEDGTILFYTMDGKQPGYAIGANCAQIAQRLKELGCVEAVGLDGGGSTTLGLTTPADSSMQVVNRPSDGAQRPNSTAIFLTTELKATGKPAYLQVTPADALMLSGAQLPLTSYLVDTGYRLMGTATKATYEADENGTVQENIFTAGDETGTVRITAKQDDLTGAGTVTVISTPDEILVTEEASGRTVRTLSLDPRAEVPLTASAIWRKLPLMSDDADYTWACDEAVGTVTADGRFVAGERTSSGELTVTAGERVVTIPVNVAGHILPLYDMEGKELPFGESDGITLTLDTNLTHVRTGRQSLRVDYTIGDRGAAVLETEIPIPAGERYVGLWVWGDGSTNSLVGAFTNGERERLVSVCGLGFTGWKHVLLAVPEGFDTLSELRFLYGGGESREGAVWLDQVTIANEQVEDMTPPIIDLTVEGNRVKALVSDNIDRSFEQGAVVLQYDGATLSGNWNKAQSLLTAPLPEGVTGTHRITVTAVDVSGNLGRASYDLVVEPEEEPIQVTPELPEGEPESNQPEPAKPVFADMEGHWAEPYALYLFEQGVTKGSLSADGLELHYLPNANITRAEFFTMVARWMGLDLTDYQDYELPFADNGEVPAWAVAPLAAMYDRGIVTGSLDMGVLYAHPLAGISRAEVMTILGRTQMRGYPEAKLEEFTDYADVPAWAESYVRSLVGQKIVNGYQDGTLGPNNPMTRGEVAKVLYALR